MCNANEVVNVLQHIYPEKTVELTQVSKPNGVMLTGVIIKCAGATISPIIYLNNLEERSLNEVVDNIVNTYDKTSNPEINYEMVFNFETCKDLIKAIVVNKETNKEMVEKYVGIDFLDLYVIPIIEIESCQGTVKITKEMAKKWDVKESKIIDCAIDNLLSQTTEVSKLSDIINIDIEFPMWVIGSGYYSASRILDEQFFIDFANKEDTDLFIIPSSIHDLIILPYDEDYIDYVNDMINQVNMDEVEQEIQLSNHVYIYSRTEGWKY